MRLKSRLSIFILVLLFLFFLFLYFPYSDSSSLLCPSPCLFLSTPRQLSLCFSLSASLFSFLFSHLVTRPLERSVEFPLSQRRGQSEPHKDPQWTPSAHASLRSDSAQLHTHTQSDTHTHNDDTHTLCFYLLFLPHFIPVASLCMMFSFISFSSKSSLSPYNCSLWARSTPLIFLCSFTAPICNLYYSVAFWVLR